MLQGYDTTAIRHGKYSFPAISTTIIKLGGLSLTKSKPFTRESVIRIQRAAAKKHSGHIPKGSFAAKAQSIFDKQQSNNGRP
jgi:hypothetical protein